MGFPLRQELKQKVFHLVDDRTSFARNPKSTDTISVEITLEKSMDTRIGPFDGYLLALKTTAITTNNKFYWCDRLSETVASNYY